MKFEEFKKALQMRCKGVELERRTGKLFMVVDKRNVKKRLCGVYVREARSRNLSQGYWWWGLYRKQLEDLNRLECPQWVVLLFGDREDGYVATLEQANRLIASGLSYDPSGGFPREYKLKEHRIRGELAGCKNFEDIFGTLGLSNSNST